MKLTPTDAQEQVIAQFVADESGGCLLGSDVGTGKTIVAIETALRLWAARVIIIAPPGTYGTTENGLLEGWSGTLLRQSGQTLLRASNKNKAEKANLAALMTGSDGWFFVSRELFASLDFETKEVAGERKRVQKRVWEKHLFDVAIYDEVQMASNKKSQSFKAWKSLKAHKKIAASADWFGDQVLNMWSVSTALWPETTDKSAWRWADEWLTGVYDHFSYGSKKYTAEKEEGAFARSLPCYARQESDLGVPPVPEVRWVELGSKQRKMYDQLEKELVLWIEENPLVIEMPATLRTRLRQLTLGEFYLTEDNEVDFPALGDSVKLDEAKQIMADHPGKFILFTDSQRFARVAASRLKGAAEYSGKMSNDEREAVKRDFIEGDLQVIVAVIAAMGVGVDGLQNVCHNMIFLSESDTEYMGRQAIGRLWRKGQTKPVNVWQVRAVQTYDEGQASALMQKALINNAAKLAKNHATK